MHCQISACLRSHDAKMQMRWSANGWPVRGLLTTRDPAPDTSVCPVLLSSAVYEGLTSRQDHLKALWEGRGVGFSYHSGCFRRILRTERRDARLYGYRVFIHSSLWEIKRFLYLFKYFSLVFNIYIDNACIYYVTTVLYYIHWYITLNHL